MFQVVFALTAHKTHIWSPMSAHMSGTVSGGQGVVEEGVLGVEDGVWELLGEEVVIVDDFGWVFCDSPVFQLLANHTGGFVQNIFGIVEGFSKGGASVTFDGSDAI